MNRARDPWPPPQEQEKGRQTESRRPEKNRFSEKRQDQCNASRHPAQADRPFTVFIRAFGHFREWGKYSSKAESQAVIAQLRRHGFDATCERAAP